jgi:hypothetical protein
MRIWDINPGYLNRQSLLGEHRELHGLVSIILSGKKGYAKHPETNRWMEYGWAIKIRHKQLTCEMALRGFIDKSPVTTRSNKGKWPNIYIDPPERQFRLLKDKYTGKERGRIPLPRNRQQLWSQHKYSVLARDPNLYKKIGCDVSRLVMNFTELSLILTEVLRVQPTEGGIRNAIQHMWGYVSGNSLENQMDISDWPLQKLLLETQKRAMANGASYIRTSTALSELMVWLPNA